MSSIQQLWFRFQFKRLLLPRGQGSLAKHLDHVIQLVIVELGNRVFKHELARQYRRGQSKIFSGPLFEEKLKGNLTLAQLAPWRRRLRPMLEDIVKDPSGKSVA
jgi:hypothetical protein